MAAFSQRLAVDLTKSICTKMASFIDTIKAIITRLIFSLHGAIAIYRVVTIKNDPWFWYLSTTIVILIFEGVFTLAIKKTQEWKWFCPSIFLYLASVCPSIWLIELDKLDTRLAIKMKESLEQLHPSGLPTMEITTSTTTSSSTTTIMSSVYLNNSQEGGDMSNDSNTKVDLGVLKDVGVSTPCCSTIHAN